jgi:hypothetical protein
VSNHARTGRSLPWADVTVALQICWCWKSADIWQDVCLCAKTVLQNTSGKFAAPGSDSLTMYNVTVPASTLVRGACAGYSWNRPSSTMLTRDCTSVCHTVFCALVYRLSCKVKSTCTQAVTVRGSMCSGLSSLGITREGVSTGVQIKVFSMYHT